MSNNNRSNRPDPNNRSGRPTRRKTLEDSLGSGKLNVYGNLDENYYYRVVNDERGRVHALQERGYEIVEQGSGVLMGDANPSEPGSRIETTGFYDKGTKAVLMRQPKPFREEDNAYRHGLADKSDETIFRTVNEKESGLHGSIKQEKLRA